MKAGQIVSCKCHNGDCQNEFQIILVAALNAETSIHEITACPFCLSENVTVTQPKKQRMI